jgi:hypothetical protein
MHPNGKGHKVYKERLVKEISSRGLILPDLEGVFDGIDCDLITGWAWDKSRPDSLIFVDIYDGSRLLMTVRADQFRGDLVVAEKGNGNHAFFAPVPMELRDGKPHSISVKFSGTESAKLSGTGVDLYLSPITFTCGLQGALDSVDCNNISGRAWDTAQPGVNISVDIFEGEVLLMSVLADNGDQGFIVPLPSALKDNIPHSISVRFSGSNLELNSSPKPVFCQGSLPAFALSCTSDVRVLVPTGQSSVVVNYRQPIPNGLEPIPVFCSPPSGSSFPIGATTVTCSARNMAAACTFIVNVIEQTSIDVCLQDESNGYTLKFNSPTGVYKLTDCKGFTLTGTGAVTSHGGVITLQNHASDHRVLATIDTNAKRGSASIQILEHATTITITDRNTEDNACACP